MRVRLVVQMRVRLVVQRRVERKKRKTGRTRTKVIITGENVIAGRTGSSGFSVFRCSVDNLCSQSTAAINM